jgi:hypothetical protein
MKRTGWLAVVVAVVVVGALVFLMQKKPVKNGIAAEPNACSAMTAAEISSAINYGKSHREDLLIDFEKPWSVFLGYNYGKGGAIIYTPYHCLALIARNAVRDNSATDTESLCRLCGESCKDPYFEITLYGYDTGFDRDYKAVILKDGQEIAPLKTVRLDYDQAREYIISGRQELYFAPDVLQEKEKITLRIIIPKAAPLDFVFDLKNVP